MPEQDFETLPNPPIIEAIIDLDVELKPGTTLEGVFDSAVAALGTDYPKHKTESVQTLDIGAPASKQQPSETRGWLFFSTDDKQIVQVRRDGFTFNRLAPYRKLDHYLSEIRRTWGIYNEIVEPARVSRVGLRFVNQVMLPREVTPEQFGEYFTTLPQPPPAAGMSLLGFFSQQKIKDSKTGLVANIVLASRDREAERGKVPIIVDIATSKHGKWERNDGSLWDALVELRDLKNRLFFGLVKEQCLTLFR
ncbi:MAG: TIGR04255 family protein [Planctomycetes bacterium]|nr:TIGR04255 family protein [Planctomycetota bacterium]MCC7170343.1 TIGR04255 family protein [Planctomycetota bacterium]